MRGLSLCLLSVVAVGGLAACADDTGVRVRAIDTPPLEQPQVVVTLSGVPVLAPAQLPSPGDTTTVPAEPVTAVAQTVAPVETQPPAPAPETAAAPTAAAAAPAEPVVVAAEPAAPSAADLPSIGAAPAVAQPAAVVTTAFTSPPTTVIVKHEMPNVVCMNLQAAQNLIQKAGVFYSTSFDATGQGRKQIWDRNWIVVSQNLAPGTAFGNGDAKLGAVKKGDPNDC